jgi:hypothetical protein
MIFSWKQCCGSWFLPIPDPGSKNSNKREGWKKIFCHNFLCSHKFHKIANYFSFEVLKKKIWAHFQRIIELFTLKIVTKPSKIWIPDPGVKKAPDPGSGSATLVENRTRPPGPGSKIRCIYLLIYQCCGSGFPRDPVPFWTRNPGSRMGKKSRFGSGMNIPALISDSLEKIFWVKNT